MTAPAAPPVGRRASLGAAAVLAGFLLLAPPLFMLGPFALLTLLARPRTLRELLWLGLSAVGAAATLSVPAELGPEVLLRAGLTVSVVFALLSFKARGPVFPRALLTVALTVAGIAAWLTLRGVTWSAMESSLTEMLRQSYRAMVELASGNPQSRQDAEEFFQEFIVAAPQIARVMPGLLALQGLGGLLLAWGWHHRISAQPLGIPPARFRDFRFNDHLVWGAIFTLGSLLLPLPAPGPAVAINLVIFWAGLYALRGLAVLATLMAPLPAPLRFFAIFLALPLLPVVLGTCLALGLADTWLDIRERLTPKAPEGA